MHLRFYFWDHGCSLLIKWLCKLEIVGCHSGIFGGSIPGNAIATEGSRCKSKGVFVFNNHKVFIFFTLAGIWNSGTCIFYFLLNLFTKVREIYELIGAGIQPLQNTSVIGKVDPDDASKRVEWAKFWVEKGFTGKKEILITLQQKMFATCFADMKSFFLCSIGTTVRAKQWKILCRRWRYFGRFVSGSTSRSSTQVRIMNWFNYFFKIFFSKHFKIYNSQSILCKLDLKWMFQNTQ